ncbi:NAD(P)-dependent oxidoreductase [Actibacterium sp. XHP0104]|uniref:NAD(P)-dependent oxidoreductase n=1 Tax=Actibacterium sp. XHP0104 TaxID=2984335 RepID=UPI0021E9A9B8|nr:DUF1932 domain-containing protein [Actibacterium sp. XHP0104]MCV2882290.1 DUF1932 domain-containing protein [Actibacterium sp. XHP0104]
MPGDAKTQTIGFLGFGEAGLAFARGLMGDNPGLSICAYDIKTDHPATRPAMLDRMAAQGVRAHERAGDLAGCDLVFSLVTADQAGAAAGALALADLAGVSVLDCNSCAPETKRANAALINAAGGTYLDMAVMAPVHPRLHRTPCLLSGANATALAARLNGLSMATQVAGDAVGLASTRKMVRSIMVKGIEALTVECMLAARKAGVEEAVLASLADTFPGINWAERAPYMIERAITHGTRRAAEMDEVAKTVRDLGLAATMAEATATRQRDTGALGLNADAIGAGDLAALTDAMLAAIKAGKA